MYAVIVSGGKQHRVKEGETLKLEKLEVETGGNVEFDRVLLIADGDKVQVGAPVVDGAKVTAEVATAVTTRFRSSSSVVVSIP